jgi:flavin reductase (DIM6/NTAB) family NADH-FMN oxidoreductase RutF
MPQSPNAVLTSLDLSSPIWDRFFTVAPLVVIGTREPDGSDDLAPKHMVTALGWENIFGFVCTESHGTYRNIVREGEFTVSFPNPDQIVLASLSASPRCDDDTKPAVNALPTFPATTVNAAFLKDGYLFLECRLERIVDGFGINSLIAGRIVEARVRSNALREQDRDDQDILLDSPLLAYISPGRYATIDRSYSFPFPQGYRKGNE